MTSVPWTTQEVAERVRRTAAVLKTSPEDVADVVTSLVASGWSVLEALSIAFREIPGSRKAGVPPGWIADPVRLVWLGPAGAVVPFDQVYRSGRLAWDQPGRLETAWEWVRRRFAEDWGPLVRWFRRTAS